MSNGVNFRELALGLRQQLTGVQAELAAIKAQEPVAWVYPDQLRGLFNTCGSATCAVWNKSAGPRVPLYAAPVSEAKAQGVVMPERKHYHDYLSLYDKGEAIGHNNALAEVARLNAAPVERVSVPDGWRELLCAIEQFFEGAGVSPGPDIELRMATMIAAAPAAPAADAGLVEALDYQVLFDAIAEATSVYANGAVNISVRAFRDALAAHRAKGVE